ncbi:MAG: hypothetical protein R3208_00145 [Ketobacteraceae bacterium]|nr:hypothetical protein [Ketobacteraceae bacterium]
MDIVFDQPEWRLRLAQPEDNDSLCALFRSVSMPSDLILTEEREPDFFALRKLHSGTPYTIVLEDKSDNLAEQERIAGCCSVVVRKGWLNGEIKSIGYLCDLRMAERFRSGKVFPQSISIFIDYIKRQEPVDVFYFSIMRSNASAQYAQRMANASLITPYHMVNLQVLNRAIPQTLEVNQLQDSDIPELAAFLGKQARKRAFGFVIDEAMLRNRIESWPDFGVNNFFAIRNKEGKIVACAAPWNNADSLRRSRVHGYRGTMKLIRKGIDLEARLRGHAPMPKPGECFNLLGLTHLEIENDDPELMNQLLRGIYNHHRGRNYHFIAAFVPQQSKLEKGLSGFRVQKVPMDLYGFRGNDHSFDIENFSSINPGFEMALH